jgi:DNA invertase Pin-like site-specific DNA recombinase
MKRVAIYTRVSTSDQSIEPQLLDLRRIAAARGYEIVKEHSDTISGTKSRRPGVDALLSDARRHRFDVVSVWAFDGMARWVRPFLEALDDLSHFNIEFISFRENIEHFWPVGTCDGDHCGSYRRA